MRHGFCCHGVFGYHSFHSGIPFVRIVMEVVCIFSVSLVVIPFSRVFSYRRICFFGVIADVLGA